MPRIYSYLGLAQLLVQLVELDRARAVGVHRREQRGHLRGRRLQPTLGLGLGLGRRLQSTCGGCWEVAGRLHVAVLAGRCGEMAGRWLGGVADPNPNPSHDWLGGVVARVAVRAMVRAETGLVVAMMAAAGVQRVPGIRERPCRA